MGVLNPAFNIAMTVAKKTSELGGYIKGLVLFRTQEPDDGPRWLSNSAKIAPKAPQPALRK